MLNMVEINRIKLDKADRVILAELDKNCRIPSTILARKAGKSRQAVDYRINQLVKEGIITGFYTSINPHKMGYKIYKIYLKLRNIPAEKKRLLDYLRASGKVYWMGECSGSWDLIFGILSKSDYEFFELKNDMISEFNKIIIEEEGQTLLDVQQYPKMYFTKQISEPAMFGGEVAKNELDKTDYAILSEIVNNGRMPLVDLSGKVKSTAMIVKGRMKKMESLGIIIQYRIGVDLNKLGLELYKAVIKLDKYGREEEKKLLRHMSRLPNIQYLIRNIWSVEPELIVDSYQEYYKIIEDLKKEFPEVIRTVDSMLMITDEWTPGFRNLFSPSRADMPD